MSLAEVRWIDAHRAVDDRGTLTALERPALPFDVRRVFYMHQVPPGGERGAHAHRDTQQCAVAVAGTVTLELADGIDSAVYVLDDPNRALYMPAMTWVRLYEFSAGAVAMVLCDTVYNPANVIRSWNAYLAAVRPATS